MEGSAGEQSPCWAQSRSRGSIPACAGELGPHGGYTRIPLAMLLPGAVILILGIAKTIKLDLRHLLRRRPGLGQDANIG